MHTVVIGDLSYKIKEDEYYKRKGGLTSIIKINCRKCGAKLAIYQKDGKQGWLKRCYLNRFIWFNGKTLAQLSTLEQIRCKECGALMGKQMVHKDGRKAFALTPRSFVRRVYAKYGNWKPGTYLLNRH